LQQNIDPIIFTFAHLVMKKPQDATFCTLPQMQATDFQGLAWGAAIANLKRNDE
jgi:hypothetical protein